MKFEEGHFYHIYNQGNNKQIIFFQPSNYIYFLRKLRKFIKPYCEIISYCLLPTNFNVLIYTNNLSLMCNKNGVNVLSEGLRNLLSSYTKGINVQEKRTGSLFRQNSKFKLVDEDALNCFLFIHQKVLIYGIVKKIEDWKYSSFLDYYGSRNGTLCNKKFAYSTFKNEFFYRISSRILTNIEVKKLF